MPTLGVVALQGDVREHVASVAQLGVEVVEVRAPRDMSGVDALIFPGGESTTISYLLETSGLRAPVGDALRSGLPVLGTCAGLIMLSTAVRDGRADQWSFGAIDVTVRRNGYGRQIASFEAPVSLATGGTFPGVFIRAPRMTQWGDSVEVLATYDHGDGAHPVLVRQGNAWGCSFHPELTSDFRIHAMFLDAVATHYDR